MYWISVQRHGAGLDNAGAMMVVYYTGALSCLDVLVSGASDRQFQYGRATFYAVETTFLRPLDYIPLIRDVIPEPPAFLSERQEYKVIGRHISYNAFQTAAADGYLDFGFPGVLFIGALIGFVTSYAYRLSIRSSSPIALCF
jgi:oligosaccharide repeat unit polymerase